MINKKLFLLNEKKTLNFGNQLSLVCKLNTVIYLNGDLGTGKTTFSRGFLQALGYSGVIKSPTYTIIESYLFKDLTVYHCDLYRIQYAEELEFTGIRDLVEENSIFLIEWPQKGIDILPKSDIEIIFYYHNRFCGRKAHVFATSKLGNSILLELTNLIQKQKKIFNKKCQFNFF